jgi:dihydrofolate reductase
MSELHVFMAVSLDGFIAGPNNELDWLEIEGVDDTFTPFFERVGALLMGRNTYDIVRGFGAWPYGDTPAFIATHRPLEDPPDSVHPVSGTIEQIVARAKETAGDRIVYLDGGALVRKALTHGLVDVLTLTVMPVILGDGIALLPGVPDSINLQLESTREVGGGAVELSYRIARVDS